MLPKDRIIFTRIDRNRTAKEISVFLNEEFEFYKKPQKKLWGNENFSIHTTIKSDKSFKNFNTVVNAIRENFGDVIIPNKGEPAELGFIYIARLSFMDLSCRIYVKLY